MFSLMHLVGTVGFTKVAVSLLIFLLDKVWFLSSCLLSGLDVMICLLLLWTKGCFFDVLTNFSCRDFVFELDATLLFYLLEGDSEFFCDDLLLWAVFTDTKLSVMILDSSSFILYLRLLSCAFCTQSFSLRSISSISIISRLISLWVGSVSSRSDPILFTFSYGIYNDTLYSGILQASD